MGKTAAKSIQRKVQDNIQGVRDRIARACSRANRDPASVRLVAVTKSVDIDVIRIVLESGLVDLGESRVQQLAQRGAMIAETQKRRRILESERGAVTPVWHMIGHLQRNKAKDVVRHLPPSPALHHCSAVCCNNGSVRRN